MKKKTKLTKKQIIILIIITIILGTICYFLSVEITKSIIDHKTIEEKMKSEDFKDLRKLETISNINLLNLVNNYNDISSEDINILLIENNKIKINDIEIEFILKNENVSITSINFNKKNNTIKSIISNMIRANNEEIDENTTSLIYNKVFETLGNTSDKESKTSEFFQYKGLEFSLKEYKNNNYRYSFRIGRIIEE